MADIINTPTAALKKKNLDYQYGFSVRQKPVFVAEKGLSRKTVEQISYLKNEPDWMRKMRLQSLEIFFAKKMPEWGADLSKINFEDIYYYIKPTSQKNRSWNEVPPEIKYTFEKLGIKEAEQKLLAGVELQFDSDVVYGSIKKNWEEKGVIFTDTDTAVRQYPEIVKKYFATIVPPADNKFAALNTACWSGGSFIWVPPGVEVDIPLQAYFRINASQMGQFERTLIIAEEGSKIHYIEGCTAPIYSTDSLHAAVVEIIVKPKAKVQYTTVQNWSKNVYNLVTKRAFVEEEGEMRWLDANLGSKVTMKYPSFYLKGRKAKGETMSLAVAGNGQNQDAGSKAFHLAPETSSRIISKSVSFSGGKTTFRGLVRMIKGVKNSKTHVQCNSLILDEKSSAQTYPTMQIEEKDVLAGHEATVGKIGEDQLFYLQSRGITESDAIGLVVNGFFEPIVKEIPLEYAVELNRLLQLEMENSIG